jgi:Acyl-CoA synthetase (NDP forming)
MNVIENARAKGIKTLSEDDSRTVLAEYGLPLVESRRVTDIPMALLAAAELGFPVALKGTGSALAHKTESDVVRLNLRDDQEVTRAYEDIRRKAGSKLEAVLVQRMIKSEREFVAGLNRDLQFGPCVMFGLGGIFTEVLKDVTFRVAPLSKADAAEMLDEIKSAKLLGAFRGKPAVDREALCDLLIKLGQLGLQEPHVMEVDINPVLIDGTSPVAVDALVVLSL